MVHHDNKQSISLQAHGQTYTVKDINRLSTSSLELFVIHVCVHYLIFSVE